MCRVPLEVRRVVDQPLHARISYLRRPGRMVPQNLPALHVRNDTQIPCVMHLRWMCFVGAVWTKAAWSHETSPHTRSVREQIDSGIESMS